jgi:hypothetical protein
MGLLVNGAPLNNRVGIRDLEIAAEIGITTKSSINKVAHEEQFCAYKHADTAHFSRVSFTITFNHCEVVSS